MRGFELDETGCGLIDILDFPLNPPEGDGIARGGVDFGVYRSRYEQYHTGEDWWTSRGRRSFGTPVYSIGNGRVTYAAPLGWGRDQGVVIIRHTFEDGRQLLSFYGHLDPPSVTLRAGDCVKRGEQVGNIGQPRTPPHLHFEIRTHMPDEPGGGYWWQDPTLDGWLPPSETIWQERMAKSPGVQWLRAPKSRDFQAIGSQDDIFLILEGEQIIGLDAASGRQRWSFVPEIRTVTAALDSTGPIVYVSDRAGRVTAFRLPRLAVAEDAVDAEMPLEPLWQIDLDVVGTPELIPFPSGGFMLAARSHAVAVSSEGEILWQNDAFDRLSDWVRIGDRLVLSTMSREESLWIANEGGLRNWTDLSGGALTALQDRGLLLNSDGLFRLNPEDETDVLLSEWPNGGWQGSDVLGLEDGGALVTYVGRGDRRLIHFDAEGVVKWQYSFPDEAPGVPRLFDLGGTPFISVESQSGDGGTVSIYAIDSEQGQLTLLFSGGTRMVGGLTNTLYPSDFGTLFLRIGGGHLVSLDLDTALDRVANSTGSGP